MAAAKQIKLVVAAITLFFVLALLGIGIATLVKVYSSKPKPIKDESGLSDKPNILNVPAAFAIDQQAGGDRYEAFESYVKTLKNSLNITVNPCDDFYAYTCSALSEDESFLVADFNNADLVWKQSQKDQNTNAGKQASYHFKKCVEAHKDATKIYRDGKTIKEIYQDFLTNTKIKFPLFDSSWNDKLPTPVEFGTAIGYLSGRFGIETLLSSDIDANWARESNSDGQSYTLLVDQTKLAFPDSYYLKAWNFIKDSYRSSTHDLLADAASTIGVGVSSSQIYSDIDDIFKLEQWIASHNPSLDDKRKFER
ncbi:Phosphate-regulating neutral endopeptidase [Aphelenchoides bicaudatus]|nr:Phosphate-regulating neutral endopeptidase [Aphelenchoides bicaudatus]